MFTAFLIKYGEIGIKGKNRYMFEDALIRQMKFAVKEVGDFVMDVLTGGGLGDLFRKLILGDKQITVTNSLAIAFCLLMH